MIKFFLAAMSVLFSSSQLDARRIYPKTIAQFVQEYPETKLIACTHNHAFNYTPYPLYEKYPQSHFQSTGYYNDLSVIEIPSGVAYIDLAGRIFVNDRYIRETFYSPFDPFIEGFMGRIGDIEYLEEYDLGYVAKIPGRVAILSHPAPFMYGHWVFDILGQLALLEMHNIEYDYLWIPYNVSFMQETLRIWGINPDKIIPLNLTAAIQADTIIIPTTVAKNINRVSPHVALSTFYIDITLKYVRDKMLNAIKTSDLVGVFSDKIFISRRGAKRFVPNEDQIFELFKPLGFERYDLESLSVREQIALFHNARTIVSFVGSGSTNIMFCQPNTLFIEIVQCFVDPTFFLVSDIFKLKYDYINASTEHDVLHGFGLSAEREFPLNLIEEYIKTHFEEKQ